MAKHLLSEEDSRYEKIMHSLGNLKYKDLQAEVIQRGMGYKEIITGDHTTLSSFYIAHFDEPLKKARLKEFQNLSDKSLEERGYKPDDPIRKYARSQFENPEDEDTPKAPKEKVEKPKKEKRQKDAEFGIFEGTKKQLTFKLAKSLWNARAADFDNDYKRIAKKFAGKLFRKVQVKFPDAAEKSVKIWMVRCLKEVCEPKDRKK